MRTADARIVVSALALLATTSMAAEAPAGASTCNLADLRLNPWWYPHDSLYNPADDGSGHPLSLGRAIDSSRSVGFTGWIGGVAMFNRALTREEHSTLSAISRQNQIAGAE